MTEHYPEDKQETDRQLAADKDIQAALKDPLDYVYTAPSEFSAMLRKGKATPTEAKALKDLQDGISAVYKKR